MPGTPYVQALALGIDPAWRRLATGPRQADVAAFGTSLDRVPEVTTRCYSSLGRRPGVDLFLWRLAPTLDALEEAAGAVLGAGLGRWCSVTESFLGVLTASPYGRRTEPESPHPLFAVAPRSHLIVYPFTKTTDWWLLDEGERRRVMAEHIAVGRSHGGVRQLLANSFGIGDHDTQFTHTSIAPKHSSRRVAAPSTASTSATSRGGWPPHRRGAGTPRAASSPHRVARDEPQARTLPGERVGDRPSRARGRAGHHHDLAGVPLLGLLLLRSWWLLTCTW